MDNLAFIQAKTTKTAGIYLSPTMDISGVIGDYTVFLRITKLVGTARFSFYDSLDAFATAGLPGPAYSFKGSLDPDTPVVKSFLRRDFPSMRFGVAGASMRVALAELTGDATKTVTFESWIQWATVSTVALSPDSQTVLAAGGTGNITVTTNRAWILDPTPSWVVCTPTSGVGSGTIGFTAAVNATGLPRQALITVNESNPFTLNQGAV